MSPRTVLLLAAAFFLAGPASAQSFAKAELAWTLPWDVDWPTAVAFPGNDRVAAGNNLGHLLLWDLPAKTGGKLVPRLKLDGHTNTVNRLLATPDGRWLISASNDRTIRLWDLQASPKGNDTVVLNAGAIAEAVQRKRKPPAPDEVKVPTLAAAHVLQEHKDWVLGLALGRDGRTLVSGDDKGEVIVWDLPERKVRHRWRLKGWVWALDLSPDGKTVAVSERIPLVFDSGRLAALKVCDAATGKVVHDLSKTFAKQFLAAAAFSPDGKTLAVGRGGEVDGMNGKVTLLDPSSGKKLRELTPGHLNGLTDLTYLPDGKHLASSGRDTLVRIWSAADGKLVKELGKGRGGQFKDWICAVAVAPDARHLAAADMAGQVLVYRLRD